MPAKKIKTSTPEGVKKLYANGFSLIAIQNLTGFPAEESSRILKEAGLFNPHRQRDYYREQEKNKRTSRDYVLRNK